MSTHLLLKSNDEIQVTMRYVKPHPKYKNVHYVKVRLTDKQELPGAELLVHTSVIKQFKNHNKEKAV